MNTHRLSIRPLTTEAVAPLVALWTALEVTRYLGVPRLIGLIEPGNTASAHVAEKLGMTLERQTTRPGGRVMEVWAMGAPNR